MELKYMMKKTTMDVNSIRDYIIKTYPDCCLAENILRLKNNYGEEDLIEACEDFFYYEKLNWCGCGNPEAVKTVVRDFLRIIYDYSEDPLVSQSRWDRRGNNFQERFGARSVYDNELLLCLAYALDAAEFTDHGSSIGGAWIDTEGKMFLWLLNQNKELDKKF